MREVGQLLGIGEDAAKKRISRAVDRLRAFLAKQGITLSGAALGALLIETRAQTVPAGLAQDICSGVQPGSATTTSATIAALVAGGLRDWFWASARQVVPWAIGSLALVGTVGIMLSSDAKPTETTVVENQEVQAATSATGTTLLVTRAWEQTNTPAATDSNARTHFYLSVMDGENNQPIAGARALAQFWGINKVDQSIELKSNANGSIVVDMPDKPFRILRIWLSAAGFVPLSMDWQVHEFGATPVLHTSRLTRGKILQIDVVDGQGQPVAGAKIEIGGPGINTAQRENISYHPRLSGGRTDDSGHYECDQIPPSGDFSKGGVTLGISHRDFATEIFSVRDTSQLVTNHVITLEHGVRLAGRVVGAYDEPVANARLEERYARFGIETKTDSTGYFEFSHVKPRAYTLAIRAAGYSELVKGVLVETNAPEITLRLAEQPASHPVERHPLHLVGTVVDAENSEPIPSFRVLLNEHRGTAQRLLGASSNGAFDWETDMMYIREFSLAIEAEGYDPTESDVRPIGAAEQQFLFQLKRGSDLTGWVLQPDGLPATNATLGLSARGKYGLMLTDDGKLMNYGHHVNQTTTADNGYFCLKRMVGAELLLIAHESGCASVLVSEATNSVIQLKQWGAIEGILYVGSSPASNQTVNLGFALHSGEQNRIPFAYNTTTDAKGHFRFTHVQPGANQLQRLMKFFKGGTGAIGFSHAKSVMVEPGKTTRVVLGGEGVPVIGKLKLEPALDIYDWSLDLHALVEQRPDLPPVKWEDFSGDVVAYGLALTKRESQIAKYYLAIAPDGTFRADDVLPGNYDLDVTIKTMPEDPLAEDSWMKPRQTIGGVKLSVVVPETGSKEPLDLETVTVPITNSTVRPQAN